MNSSGLHYKQDIRCTEICNLLKFGAVPGSDIRKQEIDVESPVHHKVNGGNLQNNKKWLTLYVAFPEERYVPVFYRHRV